MMTSDEQGKVIDDSGEVVGFFVSSIVAKRAVACMTALAHVTDKQMESGELLHMGQAIKDLTKQRDELLARLDVICEVGVINPAYNRVRLETVFAIDDIEYDMFSAGWKEAIARVKGATS